MIENIKTLLGIIDTSKDTLLELLINHAREEAINYTHNEDLSSLQSTIEDMVVYNYHKLDNVILSGETYSGVTFTYIDDYPNSIKRSLKALRKLRVI